jgi:hypothetical protein
MLSILIAFAVSTAVAYFAYAKTRSFVSERLRYVDAVNHPIAPVAAGIGATLLAAPLVGLLPIVSFGTALTFGLAVGFGVSAGRGDVPRFPRN